MGKTEDCTATINELSDRLFELRHEATRVKIALDVALVKLSGLDKDALKKAAHDLYWCGPLTASELAPILEIPPQKVPKYVGPDYEKLQCLWCDNYFLLMSTSISNNEKSMNEYYSLYNPQEWNPTRQWLLYLCDDCKSHAKAQIEAEDQEIAEHRENTHRMAQQVRDNRISELRTMPYAEYLKSPEWQEIRIRKLKNAYYLCELCGHKGPMHVHHKTYIRRGEEWDRDLIVLCADCHAKFHDKLPEGAL